MRGVYNVSRPIMHLTSSWKTLVKCTMRKTQSEPNVLQSICSPFIEKNVSPCLSTFLHCHRRYEHKRPAPVTCNMAQSLSLLCGINSSFCPSFALKFRIGVASSSGLTPIPTPPHVLHLNEHFKSPLSGQLICHLTKCH